MKPAEKQIDSWIKQMHHPASKELDQRIDALWDREQKDYMSRQAANLTAWRIFMKSRLLKFAVTAIIIIAVLVGIGLFNPSGSKSGLVFANVIKPFYTARCISFDLTLNGQQPPIQDWVMGSRIRRIVGAMPSVVNIIDLETSKILTLETDSKKAYLVDLKGLPQMPPNYIDFLCSLFNSVKEHQNDLNANSDFSIENLKPKTTVDRLLEGLLIKTPQGNVEIWVDASTQMPVEIEESYSNLKIQMRNLQFHDQVDESLFSMDIPDGYASTDMGQLDLQNATEEEFIEGLRILASLNEGYFPNRVDVASYIQNAMKTGIALKRLNLSEKEELETGMKLSRHLLFLRFFKGKGQWHWAGSGVKLGQADKPIFWYQPADSENFRAIFGDLSVQDVDADKLDNITRSANESYRPSGYSITDDDGFTCTQQDTWFILPDRQIKAYALIQLLSGPKDAPNVAIKLPYKDGSIKSVLMAGKNLTFGPLQDGSYQIDFDQALLKEGQTEMIVEWTMPLSTLPQENGEYRTRLCPLMPVTEYSLTISVESNSGWVNSENPSKHTFTIFTYTNPESFIDAGSCDLLIKPKE